MHRNGLLLPLTFACLLPLAQAQAQAQAAPVSRNCVDNPACLALFEQAQQQSRAGQLAEALRSYSLAYQVTPDPRLSFSMGRVLQKQSRPAGHLVLDAMVQDAAGCDIAGPLTHVEFGEGPAIQRIELALRPDESKYCPVQSFSRLEKVSLDRTDNAWTVGDGGSIMRWDGSRWTPYPGGVSVALNEVWGSGDRFHAIAVGYDNAPSVAGVIRYGNGIAWSDTPNF